MEREEHSRHEEGTSTKERILLVAEDLFAEKGFTGTRTRDIAERAGINISTLHFHWKCKEELYTTVYQRLLAQRAKLTEELFVFLGDTPTTLAQWEEKIRGGVDLLFTFFRVNRHAARLDSYWTLEPHALSAEIEQNQVGPLLLSTAERLRQWLPKDIAQQIDLELTIITTNTLLREYFVNPAALGRFLQEESQENLENRLKHYIEHSLKRLYLLI